MLQVIGNPMELVFDTVRLDAKCMRKNACKNTVNNAGTGTPLTYMSHMPTSSGWATERNTHSL